MIELFCTTVSILREMPMVEANIPDIPIKEAAASVIKYPILSSPFSWIQNVI